MGKKVVLSKEQEKQLKAQKDKIIWGLRNKKIFAYPEILLDYLRPYHVGGFPLSILVMINELCNGLCYDRAMLMSLAFDDAKVIHGDIESLRIVYGEEGAEHAFVETSEFGGDHAWIVDTSSGLIYDKDYYFDIEKVTVNREFSKKQIMKCPEILSIIAWDFEKDKYALPLYMPFVEAGVEHSTTMTEAYKGMIQRELKKFKETIGYDAIQNEIDEDMKLMRTDPDVLDRKFGIVRDKYGREMSRGGVANPYYVSLEDAKKMQDRFDKAKDKPKVLERLMKKTMARSLEQMRLEDEAIREIAEVRMRSIVDNPTADFYDPNPSR